MLFYEENFALFDFIFKTQLFCRLWHNYKRDYFSGKNKVLSDCLRQYIWGKIWIKFKPKIVSILKTNKFQNKFTVNFKIEVKYFIVFNRMKRTSVLD